VHVPLTQRVQCALRSESSSLLVICDELIVTVLDTIRLVVANMFDLPKDVQLLVLDSVSVRRARKSWADV
jgi:chromatin remodeling complex protein RSC6